MEIFKDYCDKYSLLFEARSNHKTLLRPVRESTGRYSFLLITLSSPRRNLLVYFKTIFSYKI